ncbi:F-box domain containing protein, partial [Tanacetum coccineum]
HDGKKKRDSLYQHQEAGKQEKNQMGLLTMDDGIVNWGEHTEAEESNHALMAIGSSNEQLSLNEKFAFQANEIHEKDEKLKRYRRIVMKAVKEKEQLQKTVDSWKDSSKNLWRLIDSGMSSNSKVGLGFEIQSNNEGDKQTLNPLGPHAAHWSNYIGEVVRSVPLYYPSWEKVPKERKAAIISEIGTLFDLRPHMDSSRWTEIYEGINMHLQKAYNTNKASFKAKHWKADPTTGTYDVEAIRRARPEEITAAEWDKYIKFWNDPKNLARAAQNRLNRQKSVVTSRQGSRSLARLRDEMRQASDTQEYPSLIDTFWRTHTVDGVFPKDEDRRIYEEMKRLEATGEYTKDEINALARGGKLRGHIPYVGRVLPSRATSRPSMPAPDKLLKSMHRKVDFMMSLFRSDSKYSDMFKEFESGGASGSGGCGDDEESGDDEDGDGDD